VRQGQADWRDETAYAPLLAAEPCVFAWEWLRRDKAYREAARQALQQRARAGVLAGEDGARRWQLHAFEDPALPAPAARPVWRADSYRMVLRAAAVPSRDLADAFDVARLGRLATIVRGSGGEHLLLSDGLRVVRVDVGRASLSQGPVRLDYALGGMTQVDGPLLTLRRLLSLWRTGGFSPALHRRAARAQRLVLMLRAYDAIACGASQREIASELVDRDAAGPRWRVKAPSARSRAQRLVRDARRMAAGAYRRLLDDRLA